MRRLRAAKKAQKLVMQGMEVVIPPPKVPRAPRVRNSGTGGGKGKIRDDDFRSKEADRIRKYRSKCCVDPDWKKKDAKRLRLYRAKKKLEAAMGKQAQQPLPISHDIIAQQHLHQVSMQHHQQMHHHQQVVHQQMMQQPMPQHLSQPMHQVMMSQQMSQQQQQQLIQQLTMNPQHMQQGQLPNTTMV